MEPADVSNRVDSAADLEHRLLGRWYDCKEPATYPFGGDAAGIEFTADDRWYFLRLDGGDLVRETGFGRAGTYEILDTSGMNGPGHFQLNLNTNNGGTHIASWSSGRSPALLQINAYVLTATYAHMPRRAGLSAIARRAARRP